MKPQEIQKLQILDPTGCYGTLQRLLMDPNINQIGYAEALYSVLAKCLDERNYYANLHHKMFDLLKSRGEDMNKLLELEEKL